MINKHLSFKGIYYGIYNKPLPEDKRERTDNYYTSKSINLCVDGVAMIMSEYSNRVKSKKEEALSIKSYPTAPKGPIEIIDRNPQSSLKEIGNRFKRILSLRRFKLPEENLKELHFIPTEKDLKYIKQLYPRIYRRFQENLEEQKEHEVINNLNKI